MTDSRLITKHLLSWSHTNGVVIKDINMRQIIKLRKYAAGEVKDAEASEVADARRILRFIDREIAITAGMGVMSPMYTKVAFGAYKERNVDNPNKHIVIALKRSNNPLDGNLYPIGGCVMMDFKGTVNGFSNIRGKGLSTKKVVFYDPDDDRKPLKKLNDASTNSRLVEITLVFGSKIYGQCNPVESIPITGGCRLTGGVTPPNNAGSVKPASTKVKPMIPIKNIHLPVPKDLEKLSNTKSGGGTAWLTDEVISSAILLIIRNTENEKNVYLLSPLLNKIILDPKRREERDKLRIWGHIQTFEKVIFPLNIGNYHWVLLVVYPNKGLVEVWESMSGNHARLIAFAKMFAMMCAPYCLPTLKWRGLVKSPDSLHPVAAQKDGASCGVFVIARAAEIILNLKSTFNQTHVSDFRIALTEAFSNFNKNVKVKLPWLEKAANPIAKAAAKPAAAKPAAAKPAAAKPAAAKPAAARPAAKPAARPAAKPVAKPAAKPVAKPAAKLAARPAARPADNGGSSSPVGFVQNKSVTHDDCLLFTSDTHPQERNLKHLDTLSKRSSQLHTRYLQNPTRDNHEALIEADQNYVEFVKSNVQITSPLGLGSFLLSYALNKAQALKKSGGRRYHGSVLFLVDAKDNKTRNFYKKMGYNHVLSKFQHQSGSFKHIYERANTKMYCMATPVSNSPLIKYDTVTNVVPISKSVSMLCDNVGIGAGTCK